MNLRLFASFAYDFVAIKSYRNLANLSDFTHNTESVWNPTWSTREQVMAGLFWSKLSESLRAKLSIPS